MTRRLVNVYGHTEKLYVVSYASSCGPLMHGEGVSFEFGNRGGWVIALDELEAIVAEAKANRAAWAKAHPAVSP